MVVRTLRYERIFADGTRIDAVGYSVEPSDEYPDGVKYSFQYYDSETGETVLRYDNSPGYENHETNHHKHRHDLDEPVEIGYEGKLEEQYDKFRQEVEDIRTERK